MSKNSIAPRHFVQFSLRGMLVAITSVAVAIAVYRSPRVDQGTELYFPSGFGNVNRGFGTCRVEFEAGHWSAIWREPSQERYEMAPEGDFQTTTTFCRGWNGKWQLHGLKTYSRGGSVYATKLYDQGELRQLTRLEKDGSVLQRETRRDGRADGPYEFNLRPLRIAGSYRQGKRIGSWEHRYRAHGDWVTERQSYREGRVHGAWTWETAEGKRLQSATFDDGLLTDWNGQPWREEVLRWYDLQQVDERTRELLERPFEQVKFGAQSQNDFFATLTSLEGDPPERILIQRRRSHYPNVNSWMSVHDTRGAPDEPAIRALLQSALLKSQTLVMRHGILHIVPICEQELAHRDRTGTAAVRFSPESPQRSAWEAPVPFEIPIGFNTDWWFQNLFAETPIQIDGRAFNPGPDLGGPWIHTDEKTFNFMDEGGIFPPLSIDLSKPRLRLPPRPRREILTLVLADRGWSCEQRGNVLVMQPWPVNPE